MESEGSFLKMKSGKNTISLHSRVDIELVTASSQQSSGAGKSSHRFDDEAEHTGTDKGKGREAGADDWSRNFTEGISDMITNSPTRPSPIYLKEGDAKGKRGLKEIYPSTDSERREHCSWVKSLIISDFPKISESEIEQSFCEAWKQTQHCVNVLTSYIVDNLHNVFDKKSFVDRLHPDTYFIEPHHKNYVIKAELYGVFLSNFERESFGRSHAPATAHKSAAAFAPEPNVRAARFYQYFKAESMYTDIDYVDWLRDKIFFFCDAFRVNMGWIASFSEMVDTDSLLQSLGGPFLASYFRAVAVACWNLQTLAFAFEDPATRNTVEDGDEFDDTCMVPVVDVEKDEFTGYRGELIVSFMVAPGFYFGGCIIPAEVYLIAVDPELSELSP